MEQALDDLLMRILRDSNNAFSPDDLLQRMQRDGYNRRDARRAIQRALNKGTVYLDKDFHVSARKEEEAA